ncbi:MAG: hypothetical protein E7Z91_04935 [Cyanobacteria bacterium SIG30]|nr:hypothetical protein [Cyanobacteria bacterium SIG30]
MIENMLEKTYEVKSSDVNFNNELKPNAMFHILEDVAYINAESYGFGFSDVYSKGLAWFVIKYRLKFFEKINSWEEIKVLTWPVISSGITCRRDFKIQKENGKDAMVASSLWVMIDINKKRPIIPYKVLEFPKLTETTAFDADFDKVPTIERIDKTQNIKIMYDDIDLNGHVNNSNYIKWALESLNVEFIKEKSIKGIDIDFKKEATLENQEVEIQTQIENGYTLHNLKSGENIEHATIKIYWE